MKYTSIKEESESAFSTPPFMSATPLSPATAQVLYAGQPDAVQQTVPTQQFASFVPPAQQFVTTTTLATVTGQQQQPTGDVVPETTSSGDGEKTGRRFMVGSH